MSTYTMPAHGVVSLTCDYLGGKPEHRSSCSAAVDVRPDQLWIDVATMELPPGWTRAGGGHLCPAHQGQPTMSLVWNTSTERPAS